MKVSRTGAAPRLTLWKHGGMATLGNLTVVSRSFLLVLGTLTAAAWLATLVSLIRRRSQRASSRWRTPATGALALLLTLSLVADGFNSYYSYLPNVSDVIDAVTQTPPPRLNVVLRPPSAGPARHGEVVTLPVPGGASGLGSTLAWVWLPPQYFAQPFRRFSVVYLFHGSPGAPRDWFHAGRAQRIGGELAQGGSPVIEVAPQMSRAWIDDSECVDGSRERIETHLLRDVIPAVDQSLRTEADRSGRIFAGMSAGGFCALNLGLRHRDLVSTILDLSGSTSPTHDGGMKALFGTAEPGAAGANDPASYASHLPAGPPMRVWLDCGTSDHGTMRQLDRIAPVLRGDNLKVELHTRTGGHTYSVWRPALAQALSWALGR
jgi:enterochelin esterase-like enzyme